MTETAGAGVAESVASRCPVHGGARRARRGDVPFLDEIEAARTLRPGGGRTGVLLVNHGSRSTLWRRMLLDVHAEAAPGLLALPGIGGVRTAFMEYTEPSIATQLEAFDRDGFERVILVPLLLTVSNHSADDIPAIYGAKTDAASLAALEEDGIARYTPRAGVVMTPLLDYPKLVRENIARRVGALRAAARGNGAGGGNGGGAGDGLVLVGYGSEEFNAEWEALFGELCADARERLGLVAAEYAWCGHLVNYRRQPTAGAIRRVLAVAERALVLPILVAYDEMFQDGIIGGAIARVGARERILYAGDAILPEPAVARWAVEIVRKTVAGAAHPA